ncbi:MAG: hypothetical protein GXO91_02310 [FCB group bacterium]|nr:hypothetical protein [FCB group bacterium]
MKKSVHCTLITMLFLLYGSDLTHPEPTGAVPALTDKISMVKVVDSGIGSPTEIMAEIAFNSPGRDRLHPTARRKLPGYRSGSAHNKFVPGSPRNETQVVLVDSSQNGYGLIFPTVSPIYTGSEGWLVAYNRWYGSGTSSAAFGIAQSPDGVNWVVEEDLNPDVFLGAYPSVVATPTYPYVMMTEGGFPYYTFNASGWSGREWENPQSLTNYFSMVSTAAFAMDETHQTGYLNLATYADIINLNLFEQSESGELLSNSALAVFGNGDDLMAVSPPQLKMNNAGIGYIAVAAFFTDEENPPSASHTLVFRYTLDYGVSWSQGTGTTPYEFIPDNLFDHMISDNYPDEGEFPQTFTDACSGDLVELSGLFCTDNFDLVIDGDGNPHFFVGILPEANGQLLSDSEYSGLFHLWIDKDYLDDPGEPQTQTGWHYSRVMDMADLWRWENEEGDSYRHLVFPSAAISNEDDAIFYVAVAGPEPGIPAVVDDGGTPDDPCDDEVEYPQWSEDIYVIKSTDGGVNWWCPVNLTRTHPDCQVVEGELLCNESDFCEDGQTLIRPDEISAHISMNASDESVSVIYQMPDYCGGSTTGDMSAYGYKNRIYAGTLRVDSEDFTECTGCVCQITPGDVNCDAIVDILDIVSVVNQIVNGNDLICQNSADMNADEIINVQDIILMVSQVIEG